MQTTSLTLTTEQERLIEVAITSGRYRNEEDVLQAAMRRWQSWELTQQEKLKAVNQAIEEGFASGFAEGTIDEIFTRVMAKGDLPEQAA